VDGIAIEDAEAGLVLDGDAFAMSLSMSRGTAAQPYAAVEDIVYKWVLRINPEANLVVLELSKVLYCCEKFPGSPHLYG